MAEYYLPNKYKDNLILENDGLCCLLYLLENSTLWRRSQKIGVRPGTKNLTKVKQFRVLFLRVFYYNDIEQLCVTNGRSS